jgi:hypothetical protein
VAYVISSTRRTETPARYISIKASSTELSRSRAPLQLEILMLPPTRALRLRANPLRIKLWVS